MGRAANGAAPSTHGLGAPRGFFFFFARHKNTSWRASFARQRVDNANKARGAFNSQSEDKGSSGGGGQQTERKKARWELGRWLADKKNEQR